MIPNNALEAAKALLKDSLPFATCVVDATVGNGYDTLFLCEHTLESCRIWSFDIQKEAIETCAALLAEHGETGRSKLVCDDHSRLGDYVREPVNAAMFNLGYLPGKDHSLTTNPISLRPALDSLVDLLSPCGIITVVAYPGHAPGRIEIDFLETYLANLPQKLFTAAKYSFLNQKNAPALLYAIGKRRRNPK